MLCCLLVKLIKIHEILLEDDDDDDDAKHL